MGMSFSTVWCLAIWVTLSANSHLQRSITPPGDDKDGLDHPEAHVGVEQPTESQSDQGHGASPPWGTGAPLGIVLRDFFCPAAWALSWLRAGLGSAVASGLVHCLWLGCYLILHNV